MKKNSRKDEERKSKGEGGEAHSCLRSEFRLFLKSTQNRGDTTA